jgi:hypothetical protein
LSFNLRLLINGSGNQGGLLQRFSRDERIRLLAFLDPIIPLKSLMKIIINKQANFHHFLIVKSREELK